MTDLLRLAPRARVLEVGTGSGYQAAVLAELGHEVYTMAKPSLYDAAVALLGPSRSAFLADYSFNI